MPYATANGEVKLEITFVHNTRKCTSVVPRNMTGIILIYLVHLINSFVFYASWVSTFRPLAFGTERWEKVDIFKYVSLENKN